MAPPPKDALQRLSPVENLLLGSLAGVGTKMVNYPLLYAKNSVQQGLPVSLDPRKVYRGLPAACLNLGATTAVQFWFTSLASIPVPGVTIIVGERLPCGTLWHFQRLILSGEQRVLTATEELSAAFWGGVVSGVPCSMWELIMVQQQRFGGTLLRVPVQLVRQYGVSVLARGMLPCVGRESLYTTAMLGVCPVIQRRLKEAYDMESNTALAVGAVTSSILSATITQPMDTIKTCQQGDVAQVNYGNISSTARTLSNEYGVVNFCTKGLSWRIALIATAFFCVNNFKQALAPLVFPDEERQ